MKKSNEPLRLVVFDGPHPWKIFKVPKHWQTLTLSLFSAFLFSWSLMLSVIIYYTFSKDAPPPIEETKTMLPEEPEIDESDIQKTVETVQMRALTSDQIVTTDYEFKLEGKTLKFNFNLKYTKEDQGSQRGRLAVIAYGPSMILSYPKQALSLQTDRGLVDPHRGEFFSVSRFRKVQGEFNPVEKNPESSLYIYKIEILIYNHNKELIYLKQLKPWENP